MKPHVALFHATLNAVAPVLDEIRRRAPGAVVRNYLDEGAVVGHEATGDEELRAIETRILGWLRCARADGADGILLTCSIATPMAAGFESELGIPVIPIDRAMLRKAIARGDRIGVLATLPKAAETTRAALVAAARETDRSITVNSRVVAGAFAALSAGRPQEHDASIVRELEAIAAEADVVVLAQVSMARALERACPGSTPVLTSASSAVGDLLTRLGATGPGA